MLATYVNYIVIVKSITKCVIKRWSNNKVKLRQQKIPIISVERVKRIDEKEMLKNNKERKEQGEQNL